MINLSLTAEEYAIVLKSLKAAHAALLEYLDKGRYQLVDQGPGIEAQSMHIAKVNILLDEYEYLIDKMNDK